jgi:predicted transposase YdaD
MLFGEWKLEEALVVEREEGLEEGMAKGLAKGRAEIARNALARGVSVEFISEITGLSAEAIHNLAGQ